MTTGDEIPRRDDHRRTGRSVLLWVAAFAVAATIGFAPGWWERRLYRQTEALTGVGSKIRPGTLTEARRKIDPGRTAEQIVAVLGQPLFSQSTEQGGESSRGPSRHDIWFYYYADGTLTLNMTDGIAQRIAITYGPPLIPTSRRPQ